MYKEIFTERLKEARKKIDFTQAEVSRETNIPRSTIANYESGRNEPDIETLGKLIEFYGINANWLFGMGKRTDK